MELCEGAIHLAVLSIFEREKKVSRRFAQMVNLRFWNGTP